MKPGLLAAELAACSREAEKVAAVELAETERLPARAVRREAGRRIELAARAEAMTAVREAEAEVARVSVAHDVSRRHRDELHARAATDESVTGMDLAAADADVELAAKRRTRIEAEAARLRRSKRPQLTDNHLAELAADLLEQVTTVPVVVRTLAEHVPDVSPLVVVSQTEDTEAYGTLDASGSVTVRFVGPVDLDERRLRQALEDSGSVARFTGSTIEFDRAAWPLPRLSAPSSVAVDRLARLAAGTWVELIEQNDYRAELAARGLTSSTRNDREALTAVESANLTADDGAGSGTFTVKLGVKFRGQGRHVESRDLLAELPDLTARLANEVGALTPAGKVTTVELIEAMTGDGSTWDLPATYGSTGNPLWPATITATYRLGFAYQSASGVDVAED